MSMEVLLIKEGTKLGAADTLSAEALDSIRKGEMVTASIRRPRNPRHHRLLFALLQTVYENQDRFSTVQELLGAIKLATGLFDTGETIEGVPYAIPKSISFASMDQNSFSQWYAKAEDVILTKILPGVNRDELNDRVQSILNPQP